MKFTTLVSLAPLLGAASAQATSTPFTLDVRWSNSPLKGLLNANGRAFWINKPTTSYCPETVSDCPIVNTTSFVTRGDQLFLNTASGGGQQVYISPKGELTYTAPHSAYIPDGSLAALPIITTSSSSNSSSNSTSTSFLNPFLKLWLCDVNKANEEYKVWAEYRNTTTGAVTNNGLNDAIACTQIALEAKPYNGTKAYSYS